MDYLYQVVAGDHQRYNQIILVIIINIMKNYWFMFDVMIDVTEKKFKLSKASGNIPFIY